MELNPVIATLGRRLRLAVIGGGPGSFIGAMHRQAARLDDRYEIVTGILSSNPEKSKKAGVELGLSPDRLYSSVQELLDKESARKDGVDVIAIMTPNDSHFEYSMAALEHVSPPSSKAENAPLAYFLIMNFIRRGSLGALAIE